MKVRKAAAALATVAIVAGACSSGATTAPSTTGPSGTSGATASTGAGSPTASAVPLPTAIGPGEGALNLVIWPGYAENGSNQKDYDWVTPFEQQSGCKVTTKTADTSDDMYNLMVQGHGQWDGVSASGDASNRLIDAGEVAPINVDLIPDFKNISPFLQSPPHNTVNGVHYGVSLGWGANLLLYNKKAFPTQPLSWGSVFDTAQMDAYKGKVTAYQGPIYIADAALYLADKKPELGITDPYELTQDQFNAAVDLLKAQHPYVGKYWASYTDEIDNFENGTTTIGTGWQYQVNTINADKKVEVGSLIPTEGATGWADTWMLSAYAPHPNCMLAWMAWALKPDVQKQSAEYFGEAPANVAACPQLDTNPGPYGFKDFCTLFGATNESFYNHISFWKTPRADCGDSRGTTCVPYKDWVDAYTAILAG